MKKVITYKEYEEKFKDNMIYCDSNKQLYMDLDDFNNNTEYEHPEVVANMKNHIYGTIRENIELSVSGIVDLLEDSDNAYEDYEVEGKALEDIKRFVESWNSKHKEYSYFPNMNLKISLEE